MSFREDVKEVCCGLCNGYIVLTSGVTVQCALCPIKPRIDAIIAAHNAELERIAAGMPKKMAIGKKQSPEFLWNDGWNKAITECQAHVRSNAND